MDKIDAAAAATEQVQQIVGNALGILGDGFNGRIVNGLGIYHEPYWRRRDLTAAIDELKKAVTVMDNTVWPERADYDAR